MTVIVSLIFIWSVRHKMKKLFFLFGVVIALSFGTVAKAASWQSTWRLYNPNSGAHFYTNNVAERNSLAASGWRNEGFAWMSVTGGVSSIYRVYNPNSGEHLYTIRSAEKDMLSGAGWRYEGVSFRASTSANWSIPLTTGVYRLFNPNAGPNSSSHFYTATASEANRLERLGWRNEGIKFYVKI